MSGTWFKPGACKVRSAMLAGGVVLGMVGPVAAMPAMAQAIVSTGVGTPFELAFWQSIDSSNDSSLYESYLQRFPNGTFGEIARARIITLRGRTAVQPTQAAATPAGTVPVAPQVPAAYVPTVPVVANVSTTQTALAPAPVAALPVITPIAAVPKPAVAAVAANRPAVITPTALAANTTAAVAVSAPTAAPTAAPVAQALALTPAVATTVAPTSIAVSAPVPAQSANTLGQLLAALANSQTSGGAITTGASTQTVSFTPPTPVAAPAAAALVAPAMVAPLSASRTLAAGFAVPAQPALSPVPEVALPPSFCSAEARNAFHDSVYVPSINAAKQNNDAAAIYMRQLQSMYDQYQLSHDPDTMNAIVAAARGYQPVAQTTFSMQSALVRQFTALMAVPVVACSLPGQPSAATLAK